MKRHILVCCAIIISNIISAQNIPTGTTGPGGATAAKLPGNDLDPSQYYLRIFTPVMPTTDSARVTKNSSVDSVLTSTQYYDELHRPIQTVIKQGSATKKDFVSHNTYDEFGRVVSAYLPYVQQTSNTNDGNYKLSAYAADSIFYKSTFPNEQINYGNITYDGSPFQRVVKQTAPGNSWSGAGVGMSYSWRANIVSDSVRLLTIAIVNEDDIPSTSSMYSAGSLSVQEITDERGIKTVVYTDELGRKVLSKQQIAVSPSTGHYGWLCTYYVYDEMNHLRIVIPPKAIDILNTTTINWNFTSNPTIQSGLCFSYFYDSRNRVITKQIPGKGKNYIAYDLFDRVVMSQDPNLRQTNQWTFLKYDAQSRPFRSGVISTSTIKDSIIVQASRNTDYPALSGTYTITSETYYDDYSWISGSAPNSTLVSTYINSSNFIISYNSFPEYAQQIVASNRIRGIVTGSKKIILNSSTYLYSVPLYDDHGRIIQLKETNYTGGTDVLTKQYCFNNRVLRTHLQHQKSGINPQNHTLLTKYSYDHIGRVKSIIKNIDSLGDKTVSQESYNELGQLKTKTFGSGIDSMNYQYNIRGWLLSINKGFIDTASSISHYFGESLYYDYGFTNSQVNGSIAGAIWKGRGDGIARAYGFSYDNANRLTTAYFSQQNQGSSSWTNDKVDFSVSSLTYDGGSNILIMKQRGLEIGSCVTIDSLNYQYFANSNQLQKVSDGVTDQSPLGDFKDSSLSGDDYTYDVNGNMSKDYNRHMYSTTNGPGAVYNLLDKPDSLSISGKATLYYYYDAAGVKLRKQVNDYSSGSLVIKNYTYINDFVYINDTLQYVDQEEGRIRYAKKRNNATSAIYYAFEYDYFLRDHLNNVRAVLTEGKDTATYVATMESADSATIRALFSNVYDPVTTVYVKPSGFDANGGNANVSRVNASAGVNKLTGPSIVLKVMAGDQVQINTYGFYNTSVQTPVSDNTLLTNLLSSLVTGLTNQSGGKINSGNSTALGNAVSPNITSFLTSRSYNSSLPKAYLNWVLLDDQFNYVAGNMGAIQVPSGSSKQAMVAPLQNIIKNGYLYIYVSNQSPQDVYFDDLTVTQTTGPLIQEQSYYPFGLQMAGISDKAINKINNQNKFNGGVELEEDYGVNLYSTFYRNYDPQIGRFDGVDILSEKTRGFSGYQFATNNPIIYNDPTGALNSLPDLVGVINALFNLPYGGTWSASSSGTLFQFGDKATADFFGGIAAGGEGGGGYMGGSFFSNLAGAYQKFKDYNSKGYYDITFDINYSNKSKGYNALLTGWANDRNGISLDGGYFSLTKLGSLGPGYNYFSYHWDNYNESTVVNRNNNQLLELGLLVNKSVGSASAMSELADKINHVTEGGALKALGRVTGIIGVYDHLQKGYKNGDWIETAEGVTQGLIMIFGGEELELAYNLADLGSTLIADAFDW